MIALVHPMIATLHPMIARVHPMIVLSPTETESTQLSKIITIFLLKEHVKYLSACNYKHQCKSTTKAPPYQPTKKHTRFLHIPPKSLAKNRERTDFMKISLSNWQNGQLQEIQTFTADRTENKLARSNFIINQISQITNNYYLKQKAEELLVKNPKLFKIPVSMPTVETVLPDASLTLYVQKLESTLVTITQEQPSTLETIMPYALELNDTLRACVGLDGFELMRAVAISNTNYFAKTFNLGNLDTSGQTSRWAILSCPQIVALNLSCSLTTALSFMLIPYRCYPKEVFSDTPIDEQWLNAMWLYRNRPDYYASGSYNTKHAIGALSHKALGTGHYTLNILPLGAILLDPFLRSSAKTLQEATTKFYPSQVIAPKYGEHTTSNSKLPPGAVDVSNDIEYGIPAYVVYDSDTSSFYSIIPTEPKVWDAMYRAFPNIKKRDPLKPHTGDSDVLTDPRNPKFPDFIQEHRNILIYMGITDVRKYFGKPTDTDPSTYDEWHTFYIKESYSFNDESLKEHPFNG